jgi:hypothetical protein
MKSETTLSMTLICIMLMLASCSYFGLDNDDDSNEEECRLAALTYLSCVTAYPNGSGCDNQYLMTAALCSSGSSGGGY